MKRIILASASPRRRQLLEKIGLSFTVEPGDLTENGEALSLDKDPVEIAKELALRKATSVASKNKEGTLIIGADTIVILNDKILGKPHTPEAAEEILSQLSGVWHEVITGVALVEAQNGKWIVDAVSTEVKMKELSEDIIKAYISTDEPLDKAGAYGIQGLGAVLVEEIRGCYYNVVGLPLAKLTEMLEYFGIKVYKIWKSNSALQELKRN